MNTSGGRSGGNGFSVRASSPKSPVDVSRAAKVRARLAMASRAVVEALEQRTLLTVAAPSSLLTTTDANPGAPSPSVLLTWADNSDNETTFKVERKTGSGGTYAQVGTAAANVAGYTDATAAVGTTYYYRVRAANASEDSSYSNEALGAEWGSANVGTVTGGSYAETGAGAVTITTAGQSVGSTSDDFRFAYRSLIGDGTIVAKVTSVQNTNALAKAGVMFRDGLGAGATNVFLAITPGGTPQWQRRPAAGGQTDVSSAGSAITAPYWVKIVREGSRFTAYTSPNGTSWTQVGQNNVLMSTGVYVGLAHSSSGWGASGTSTFTDVSVTRQDHSLPSGWGDGDVGAAGFAGSARYFDASETPQFTFAVESSGQDVQGTADAFHFAHRPMTGNGEVVARVSGFASTTYAYAKAGVMFRAGTADNAKNVFLAISATQGAVWQDRSTVGGNTNQTWITGKAAPYYVKVVRSGDTFTGYLSSDGSTWTQAGSAVTISGIGATLEVGLGLSAAGYGNMNTATFDRVAITPTALTAEGQHAHELKVSWEGHYGQTGYRIERGTSASGPFTEVQTVTNGTSWLDGGVQPGTHYYYRVRGYVDDGGTIRYSGYSSVISGNTTGLGDGLTGTYYDDLDFTGTTVTRVDGQVGFHWGATESPAAGVEPPTFAVEWKGQIMTKGAGDYVFSTYSDDGVRVWINNQLKIDHWDVHNPTTDTSAAVTLAANTKCNIRIEYFQNAGTADVQLKWLTPGAAEAEIVPTRYLYAEPLVNPPAAPAAPANVRYASGQSGTVQSVTSVTLNWDAVAGASRYVIYRSGDLGATWSIVGSELSTQFTDNDQPLDPSHKYAYRVMAVNAGGRSPLADLFEADVANVQANPTGDGVLVTWDAPVGGADAGDWTGYDVVRSTDGGDTYAVVARVPATEQQAVDPLPAPPELEVVYDVVPSGDMITDLPSGGAPVGAPLVDRVRVTYFDRPDLSGPSSTDEINGMHRRWDAAPPLLAGTDRAFSAVFTTQVTPAFTGDHVIHTKANGGVRVFVTDETTGVTTQVLDRWGDSTPLLYDLDGDGDTDFQELVVLAQNYNTPGHTFHDGNLNEDAAGNVNFQDLVLLAQNYNHREEELTADGTIALTAGKMYTLRVEYRNLTTAASLDVDWTRPMTNGGSPSVREDIQPTVPAGQPGLPTFALASSATPSEGQMATVSLNGGGGIGDDPIAGWAILVGEQEEIVVGNPTSASFRYEGSGQFNLRAWVIGQSGARYPASVSGGNGVSIPLSVTNLAPVLSIDAVTSGAAEGDEVVLHANASDPGGDTIEYVWTVTKDGSPFARGFGNSAVFVPDDEGAYVATVTATDGDGSSGTATTTVNVQNAPPSVDIGPAFDISEGEPANLSAFVTDAGEQDTFTYAWSVSGPQGFTAIGSARDFTFIPTSTGAYTVDVTVTDNDGGATNKSVAVTVEDLAPWIFSPDAGAKTSSGGYYSFPFRLFDPGSQDQIQYTADWGDGSLESHTGLSGDTGGLSHAYGPDIDATNHYSIEAHTVSLTARNTSGTLTTHDQFVVGWDYHNDFRTSPGGWSGPYLEDQHYLGPFSENSPGTGSLTLSSLPEHSMLVVEMDLYGGGEWTQEADAADQFTVSVGGQAVQPASIRPANAGPVLSIFDPEGAWHVTYLVPHTGSNLAVQVSGPTGEDEAWALGNVNIGTTAYSMVTHRTGTRFGQPLLHTTQAARKPESYVMLVNDDVEEAPDPQNPVDADANDLDDRKATVDGSDDDLMKLTLHALPAWASEGTAALQLSDPSAVRIFKNDGSVLFDGTTGSSPLVIQLGVDPADPNNPPYLQAIEGGDVDIWLEGLKKASDLTISMVYSTPNGQQVTLDEVHVLIGESRFIGSDGQPIESTSRVDTQLLLDLLNDVPNAMPIPDGAKFKSVLLGVPSDLVARLRVSSDAMSGSYFDDTSASGDFASQIFSVVYGDASGRTLTDAQRVELRDRFGVNAVHNPEVKRRVRAWRRPAGVPLEQPEFTDEQKRDLRVLKLTFIQQDNAPVLAPALRVSKFPAAINLPATATFDGPPDSTSVGSLPGPDPDTFRLQIEGVKGGKNYRVLVQVWDMAAEMPGTSYGEYFDTVEGVVAGKPVYRINKHLRLVSQSAGPGAEILTGISYDDDVRDIQTIFVHLGDLVIASVFEDNRLLTQKRLPVGMPPSASGPLAIRTADIHMVTLAGVASNPQKAVERASRSWAQAQVRFNLSASETVTPFSNAIWLGQGVAMATGVMGMTIEVGDALVPVSVNVTKGESAGMVAEKLRLKIASTPLLMQDAFVVKHTRDPGQSGYWIGLNRGGGATFTAATSLAGLTLNTTPANYTDGTITGPEASLLSYNFKDADPKTIDVFAVPNNLDELPGFKVVAGIGTGSISGATRGSWAANDQPNLTDVIFVAENAVGENDQPSDTKTVAMPFTFAHELGHYLLDMDDKMHDAYDDDRWANLNLLDGNTSNWHSPQAKIRLTDAAAQAVRNVSRAGGPRPVLQAK